MKSIELLTIDVKKLFPEKIHLSTSNGNYEMNFSECQKNPPKLEVIYHHSTPTESADVLSDSEPDYFGMDTHIKEVGDKFELIVDMTYGDAMMFSFKIKSPNTVEVGHYNGHGSKFDPNYEFYLHEETIEGFINTFNKMNLGFQLTRDQFNFLDGDKNSFKMEKVRYPRISNFSDFNTF